MIVGSMVHQPLPADARDFRSAHPGASAQQHDRGGDRQTTERHDRDDADHDISRRPRRVGRWRAVSVAIQPLRFKVSITHFSSERVIRARAGCDTNSTVAVSQRTQWVNTVVDLSLVISVKGMKERKGEESCTTAPDRVARSCSVGRVCYCAGQVDEIMRTEVTWSRWFADDALALPEAPPLAVLVPPVVDVAPPPVAPVAPVVPAAPEDDVLGMSVPVISTWCPLCGVSSDSRPSRM
jgi:hypothetical protein